MIQINNVLADTYAWFEKAVPEPTEKNVRVQIGVHFEEVGEMIQQLNSNDHETQELIDRALASIEDLGTHLKTQDVSLVVLDRVAFLDSLCDQAVTGTGSGYMLRMNVVDGLNEVNRSNWSKFVESQPVFNEKGKIMKGPDYTPPNLEQFV